MSRRLCVVKKSLSLLLPLREMKIKSLIFNVKYYTSVKAKLINNESYEIDSLTNVTPKILSYLNKNLYKDKEHPVRFVKEKIVNFFYDRFKGRRGNPIFSVHEDLNPIVSTYQNFDSLLIPADHPSRTKTNCYYINKDFVLRAHMTAHQSDLLKMGLNNYLMVGDVYRRDEIDRKHYPVFHQLDGVRTFSPDQLFGESDDGITDLRIKETKECQRTKEKQEVYTLKATKMVEKELKKTLEDLSKNIFGPDVQYKWVDAYFPFTHPSWELEVFLNNKWMEMLGCGVIEHKILDTAGCGDRIGWAFGLGIERLAMVRYSVPDIRIFWSTDSGFLHQFAGKTWKDEVTFKPFSDHPACPFDMSFWISEEFDSNDYYELARDHCGDIIEQIKLVDTFTCGKTGRNSRCYRIVYRSMEKTFVKEELRKIHKELEEKVVKRFNVEIR